MEKNRIEEARRPVFIYGFELLLSTMASTISVIILSFIMRAPYTSILFILIFMGIRFFAGGYHAITYGRCFLLTNLIYLLIYVASIAVRSTLNSVLMPLLVLSSTVVILILAPIRNSNHPLSISAYRRNQKMARIITLSISVTLLSLLYLTPEMFFLPVASATLTAVAVMMIIPKILERRK